MMQQAADRIERQDDNSEDEEENLMQPKTGFLTTRLKYGVISHLVNIGILWGMSHQLQCLSSHITKTCPCNIQRFFTAVKMKKKK